MAMTGRITKRSASTNAEHTRALLREGRWEGVVHAPSDWNRSCSRREAIARRDASGTLLDIVESDGTLERCPKRR